MLNIEATRGERWGSMALTSLYLFMGGATLLICLVGYVVQPLPYPILFLAYIPHCAYHFLIGGTRLYLDWFRGRIHTRVLLNNRQLVVFRRRQRAIRVRKRGVEAVAHAGWALVTQNETRYDLRKLWGSWGTAQNTRAINAVYATWWPNIEQSDVESFFNHHYHPSVATWVFLPLVPIYFLLGWIAYTNWGTLSVFPLIVFVIVHGAVALWCALRNERRLLFYIDGTAATPGPFTPIVPLDFQD